jgi:hypothetical protein
VADGDLLAVGEGVALDLDALGAWAGRFVGDDVGAMREEFLLAGVEGAHCFAE